MPKIQKVILEVIVVIAQIILHFMNPFSLFRNNLEKFLISFHGLPHEFNFQSLSVNQLIYKLIKMNQFLL